MKTPIIDFVKAYDDSGITRFHMPGHKGLRMLGCESLDITEIKGADSLYEGDGIIAESEYNASILFGSGKTLYSTEGSSQCIRAMLYLAMMASGSKTIVAARNVHKAFVYSAALLDLDIVWLWPEDNTDSICSCVVSCQQLENTLNGLSEAPAAVYVTSPDYLGGMADVAGLAEVCHRYNTIFAVDNAHGAYLHFLSEPMHPLDLGADICCDSAHKTLPVLTGGAYLHISKRSEKLMELDAKAALALFGSTSPSYLTICSLDMCNEYISDGYAEKLETTIKMINSTKSILTELGWEVSKSDPLRITVKTPNDMTGHSLAEKLRIAGIECEYADPNFVVLMVTEINDRGELEKLKSAFGENRLPYNCSNTLPQAKGEAMISVRQAIFSSQKRVNAAESIGRICAAPTVSCPPAIPIVVSGEMITADAVELFEYYGITDLLVVE